MRLFFVSLVFALGCSSDDACPQAPPSGSCSAEGLSCTYPTAPRPTEYTCTNRAWRSNNCGDFGPCSSGDTCYLSDWERDCDCSCDTHGWACTPFYENYGCPYDIRMRDAGVD